MALTTCYTDKQTNYFTIRQLIYIQPTHAAEDL